MRGVLALLALGGIAHAQQMPCEPCVRGDDTLRQWGEPGERLRASVHALESLGIRSTEISESQNEQLDRATGRLSEILHDKLVALSPEQRNDIAATMCNAPGNECVTLVAAALVCMAGQCTVQRQVIEHEDQRPPCDRTVVKVPSAARGIGFEWATGWQGDASPVDHRAWSVGFDARARLGNRFGIVGRVDRSTGRDKAEDANGDGRDDASTGAVTRVSALAGPSVIFGIAHDRDIMRWLQLDLLGGYQWTLSQTKENGPLAGADLSYTLTVARIGMRFTQGFGDAQDSRAVLAHVGFLLGGAPPYEYGAGCGDETRTSTRVALALDIPLFGYGLSQQLDYIVPGFGVEALYHVHTFFDGFVHGDILDVPNSNRDRAIYQTLLAGGRIDLTSSHEGSSARTGMFTTLAAGYAWAATTEPSNASSGPVVEASLGWGGQGDDGAAYLRLHGRFGVLPDNQQMRAVFLSAGIELRLDRSTWKDRN